MEKTEKFFSIFNLYPIPTYIIDGANKLTFRNAAAESFLLPAETRFHSNFPDWLAEVRIADRVSECLANNQTFKIQQHSSAGSDFILYLFPAVTPGEIFCGISVLSGQDKPGNEHAFEELARLTKITAHEIRNPLTGILGATQLIRRKFSDEHPIKEFLDRIEREINRLEKITHRMNNFSTEETGNIELFNIHEVLDEIIFFSEKARPGLKVVRVYDPSIPEVLLDKGAIHKVFLNLMKNSMESAEKDIRISVSTCYENIWSLPDALKKEKKNYCRIDFSDNGCGIPKDISNQIFNLSFTTKKKGSGLGLFVCKNILEKMGGSISAANLSQPTVFRIHLPLLSGKKHN